jgi:RES domain-containing protein
MDDEVCFWRICSDTADAPAEDLSGSDTAASGARWNPPGVPLVYCAQSISLAVLETLAHLDLSHGLPQDRHLVCVSVPRRLFDQAVRFDPRDPAHRDWDAKPEGPVSIDWGSDWATSSESLLALVPSAIVPEEWNVLINPAHPDSEAVRAERRRRFHYDLRLGES